jgi:copper chaperone
MNQPVLTEFSVPGVSCDHCRSAIEGEVTKVDGVVSVLVDIDAKTVTVIGGEHDSVVAAIDAAGYDIA